MCGIAGVGGIDKKAGSRWIQRMTEILKHRGPDDEGYLSIDTHRRIALPLTGKESAVHGSPIETYCGDANFFMGHRRLSILDTSPSGHQPMISNNGNAWIVFNGEIYNYLELKEELRTYGYNFHTDSDTEVLLSAYEKWGELCLNHFDGMWAFVIYDKKKNLLFGARDRFGVKPLYYYEDADYFAFASEIKAILSLPFLEKKLNPEAVFDFLAFRAFDYGNEGFFKNVYEIKPSQAFTYNLSDGEFIKWRYYGLYTEERWEPFNETKSKIYIRETRDLIMEAIRLRLRSDVPLGSALSGGIDSTSVVSAISKWISGENSIKANTGPRQKVFTAGFPGMNVDESDWAKLAAERANAQWFLTTPTSTEFMQDIEDVAYSQEIPYGSPSIYAQYRVMKLAKENNVKVLLDGQGADELFTGYTMYYPVFFYQLLKHAHFKTFFHELNRLTNAPLDRNDLIAQLMKQALRNMIPYGSIRRRRMKQRGHHLFIDEGFWEKHKDRVDLIRDRDFKTLNGMLSEYFTRQKLGNLLRYEDRNSMRFSIEARTPFADHLKLIEYVFKIPAVYKIHDGWSKYILRESMKGIIPDEIRERTDKKGFFTPELDWLKELKDPLSGYLTDDIGEFVDIPYLKKRLDEGAAGFDYDTAQTAWIILIFSVWKRVFGL